MAAQQLAQRVLLIGWDAADWKIISPLVDAGQMPALSDLIDGGTMGEIATLNPPLSPILWTSIATGKRAFKHGIRGFVEPIDAAPGVRAVSSTSRSCKAIWNILHQAGHTPHTVGFFASHPAEPIRGICISNQFAESPPKNPADPWPLPAEAVHPASKTDTFGALRVHPSEIGDDVLREFIPRLDEIDRSIDDRPSKLAAALAKAATIQAATTAILENEPWDFAATYFDAIDVLSHHFMPFHPPRMPHIDERDFELYQHVITGIYKFHDLMLARLVELAGPDATIIVLSDHGFHSDHLRPVADPAAHHAADPAADAAMDAAWHRPLGVLFMHGPHIRKDDRIFGATLLDITPTILTMFGLPVGQDMDGNVLVPAFDRPIEIERIESWDAVEGEAGMHPPGKREQPFDQAAVMQHLVELGYLEALDQDAKKNADTAIREGNFNLAISYLEAGKLNDACRLLEPLHAAHPDEPRYATPLARCLHYLGQPQRASDIIERLVARHPDLPDAALLLAAVRFNLGRQEEAIELLSQAAARNPNDARIHHMLGGAMLSMQKWKEAEACYQKAIALNEADHESLNGLSFALLKLGRFEEAAEAALRAVGIQHFFPVAHMHLGMALTHLKEFRRALGPLELAVSMQPNLLDAHRYLATIHRELMNWDLAKKHRIAAEELMKHLPPQNR